MIKQMIKGLVATATLLGVERPVSGLGTRFSIWCALHMRGVLRTRIDEVEWQGGRAYLHLGIRRDDHPQR